MSSAPLVLALALAAEPDVDDIPPFALSVEYARLPPAVGGPSQHGLKLGLDVPINPAMTIVVEYAESFRSVSSIPSPTGLEERPLVSMFQVGGRLTRRMDKATPWGQGLLAVDTTWSAGGDGRAMSGGPTRAESVYLQPGVGLDVPLGHFLDGLPTSWLRVGVDYQLLLIGHDRSRSTLGRGWRFHAGVALPWYWFLCAAFCD